MTEHDEQRMVEEAVHDSRNPRIRLVIWILGALAVLGLLVGGTAWVMAYNVAAQQAKEGADLSKQVTEDCARGEFTKDTCEQAEEVKKKASEAPTPVIIAGQPGKPGPEGKEGPQGKEGPRGKEGKKGDKGDQGDSVQGEQGFIGLTGAAGASAYDLAVGTGFQGTLEAWLASLKGDKGDKGDTVEGPRGPEGQSAFPFTFKFVIPGSLPEQDRTYECTLTEPGVVSQCSEESPPEPEPEPTDPPAQASSG